jgi:hypothetical protein
MSDENAVKSKVGSLLKRRRQSLKLSLASVELATKIRGKYLVWIERGDYENLANDIYARGFIAKYADYLGLDPYAVTAQYLAERGGLGEAARVGSPRPVKGRRFIVTPRLLIAGSFLIVLGLVVTYLALQFSALAAAPKLKVEAPPGDMVLEGSTITVAGKVAGGADVYINDSPVLIDANGSFSNQLALQDGLNVIKVVAKNKLGKSTTVSRNILANLPQVGDSKPLVPAAPYDGVAVGVTIEDNAVNIKATIDGGKPAIITMLAGTSRSFTGKTKVKIETSNSAATGIIVTNSTVANKSLGVVGKGGNLKLEFTKDTNFP